MTLVQAMCVAAAIFAVAGVLVWWTIFCATKVYNQEMSLLAAFGPLFILLVLAIWLGSGIQ